MNRLNNLAVVRLVITGLQIGEPKRIWRVEPEPAPHPASVPHEPSPQPEKVPVPA